MAPGRKRGAKGVKTKSELGLGELVLAKVKGFPAWPAKISRPEDWERAPDLKKYFVQFYGTAEIAFVAPADIQAFTSEAKNKLSARCQGKTVKYFAQAVKEICEEFEVLQHKKINGIRDDDNNAQNLASESLSDDPVVDEALEISADGEIDREGRDCKLEINELNGQFSASDRLRKGEMECLDVNRCLEDDINPVKDSVLGSVSSSHASVKEEGSRNVKVEGRCSDAGQSELANGDQSKLGRKRKHEGTVHRNSGSVISPEHIGDRMPMKYALGGNMKVSSAENSRLGSELGSGRKGKKLVKEKKHFMAVDDQVDSEVIFEEHKDAVPRKKLKFQHDHEKLTSRTNKASCPAKKPKSADIVDGARMVRAQTSRKDPISPLGPDNKVDNTESKRLTSGVKAESHHSSRADRSDNESNQPTAEDETPPTKRQCQAGVMSTSALISENINGKFVACKNNLMMSNKVRSSGMQLPTKRRAVRLCDDDDDDELPKTPVHGGVPHKASATPRVSESRKKTVERAEGYANDKLILKKSGIHDALKEQVLSSRLSNKTSSPTAQEGLEKRRTRELSAEHICPNQCRLDFKKLPSVEAKSATDSTQSDVALKEQVLSAQLSNKTSSPTAQKATEKRRNRESSVEHVSPNQRRIDSKKLPSTEVKSAMDFTQSDAALKEQVLSARLSNKTSSPTVQKGAEKRANRDLSAEHVSPNRLQLDSKVLPSMESKLATGSTQSDSALKEHVLSFHLSNKISSPTAQKGMDKRRTTELSAEHVSPNHRLVDFRKLHSMEATAAIDSIQSVTAVGPLVEPQKHFRKTPVNISQKKDPPVASMGFNTVSDGSSLNQSVNERGKPTSPGEKRKSAPLSDSQTNNSVLLVGNPDKTVMGLGERLKFGDDSNTSFLINSKISDSATSMKHLIAAAQAKKKQAHMQNSYANHFQLVLPDADMLERSPSSIPLASNITPQLDVQTLHSNHPSSDVRQLISVKDHENMEFEERRLSSGHQATGSSLSGDTEAAVARDAFEGMIETLSRTKESIGRATRLAIDCAKYGIANEVVELLIRKLENEPSFHRRVDLFFLVDSITQCSYNQKGIAGASYLPVVQAALPRLIGAAAPPGTGAHENRRQCHKVLRLWRERKILPEYVLRRYMDDIGGRNDESSTGILQRRPSRAERAFDDPIRDMEGMFVDEYGSNATFQLPGLLPSHFFDEGVEDEDEGTFATGHKDVPDTSPSEHHTPASRDPDNCTVTPSDRRHCILEDVDGELEMEDVSAHQKDEGPFSGNDTAQVALHEPNSDGIFQSASCISEFLPSPEGSPPLPPGSPPESPPLPTSPPPSPPPPPPPPSSPSPPPPPPPSAEQHLFPPPPPFISEKSLPLRPALMPQHTPPLPSTISYSQPLTYQALPLSHEIGGAHTVSVNQQAHLVPNTYGSHIDAAVRGEAFSQQSSFFSPAAVSNVREHVSHNSSRLVEYGQIDGCLNTQAPQQTQPFLSGSAPSAQRPLHPKQMTQQVPSHFSYPNTAQQNLYPPYAVPKFYDGLRRNATDEQWRMQGSSGPPYPHAGYFGHSLERPPTSVVSFRPSAASSIPTAPITCDLTVHGVQMMPSRPDVSAINWRPG
ncbi:RPR [Orobanche gracilis]